MEHWNWSLTTFINAECVSQYFNFNAQHYQWYCYRNTVKWFWASRSSNLFIALNVEVVNCCAIGSSDWLTMSWKAEPVRWGCLVWHERDLECFDQLLYSFWKQLWYETGLLVTLMGGIWWLKFFSPWVHIKIWNNKHTVVGKHCYL